jgi:uncharacterized membrane protein YfcA
MTGLLVLAALAVLVGSVVQSATGFGFALVAAPVLFPVLGPKEAIGTLLVLACVGSVLILATERRRPRPLGLDASVIVAASIPGAVAGVVVLRSFDSVTLQYAVTGSVLVALLVRRYAPRRTAAQGRAWWSAPVAGLAAGALTTSTNTSGPPLLLHLTGQGREPSRVRDTINVCYLGLSAVSALALWATRTSGAVPDPLVLAATVPLVVLGHRAGRPVFARLVGGGSYEAVLTGTLVAAVGIGLVTAVL